MHNPGPDESALRASLSVQSGLGAMFLFLSVGVLGGLPAGWTFTAFKLLLVGGLACTLYSAFRPNDHDFHMFLAGCTPWFFLIVLQLIGVAMGWPSPFAV